MDGIDRERQYWGPERATYDDELDAWRERTAFAVGPWGGIAATWVRPVRATIRSIPAQRADLPRAAATALTAAAVSSAA